MRNAVFATVFGAGACALAALPAHAQVAGSWHVTGDVSGHGFVLDCHFEPHDTRLGGTCIEAGGGDSRVKPGKVHTLSHGYCDGQHITWAYPVSVMFLSFDISFTGTLAANAMSGLVSASGRSGKFTAVRK